MDDNTTEDLEPLNFSRYSMTDGVPVSMLFSMAGSKDTCGIYILDFADGAQYVGQTRNIVRRYADHRHVHGDIVAFSFAACEQDSLDAYERAVIRLQEQSHDLRNKLLTDLPGGRGTLAIDITETATVKLPWDRNARTTILGEPKSSKDSRFWQLAERADYPDIRAQLARYVHTTVPSPLQTAGILWTLTALPSTNKSKEFQRLLTLNAGAVEALYLVAAHDSEELTWVLNVYPDALVPRLESLVKWSSRRKIAIEKNSYKSTGPVTSIVGRETATFAHVLEHDFILDAAYRFNVTMMRRSKSVFAKFHNQAFAADIFREIHAAATNR